MRSYILNSYIVIDREHRMYAWLMHAAAWIILDARVLQWKVVQSASTHWLRSAHFPETGPLEPHELARSKIMLVCLAQLHVFGTVYQNLMLMQL